MALRNGETSHQRYTKDANEQLAAVGQLRREYARLGEEQLGVARRVTEEEKKVVQERIAEAEALEHQAKLLKINGGEQREINKLQQQALELRKQAAAAQGKESEVIRLARQQELNAATEVAQARKKAAAESVSEVDRLKKGISGVKSHWMEAVAAAYSFVQAIRTADDMMERGFQQRAIFGNLPFKINEVRTATMGLIGDMELARIAVEANRFGVAKSERELAQLGEAATKLGLSVGRDAAQSFADLNLALARTSPMILDNLGIQLKLSEAVRLYAERIGVAESMLSEEQRALAFVEIGKEKALEASRKITLTLTEEEKAWIAARQQYDKLVRETIPELTKKTAGMWKGLAGGAQIAEDLMPLLSIAIDRVSAALKGVAVYIGIFAKGLALISQGIDIAGDLFDSAREKVGEWADSFREKLSKTKVAEWAREAGEKVVELADKGISKLTAAIEKHLPFTENLRDRWIEVRDAVSDTAILAENPDIAKALEKAKDIRIETEKRVNDGQQRFKALESAKTSVLEKNAALAEFQVKMAEAQGAPAAEVERLYRAQYTAKLKVLEAAGKHAEVEALMREEVLRQTTAANKKTGGGARGPTDADRMKAAGEIQLEQWRGRLRLMQAEAALRGTTSAEEARFAGIAHNLAIEELRLEDQVLAVTRAKNSVERDRIAARREAIGMEIEILELEKRGADRAAEAEETAKWIREGLEFQRAKINLEGAEAARVISLDKYRADANAKRLEEARALAGLKAEESIYFGEIQKIDIERAANDAQYTARVQGIELETQATLQQLEVRAQLLALEDPQTEADKAAWRDAARQIEHERELARLNQQEQRKQAFAEAERARLEADVKRRRAAFAASVKIAEAGNSLLQKGSDFASLIISETIKDEDKRAKAELKARGIAAMGVGALETVKAVAAFADLNIVQGVLHSAAAAMAFVQGGIMMSGRVPGESGGAGVAASAGAGGGGGRERNTSAAPTVPDSVPTSAADRGPRRVGGPGPQTQQGGFTLIIQGDVNGNLDDETAEKWALKMRDAGHYNAAVGG